MDPNMIAEFATKVAEFNTSQSEINRMLALSGSKTVDQIGSLLDIANQHTSAVNNMVDAINALAERVAKFEGIVGAYCEAKGDGDLLRHLLHLDDLRQADEDARVADGGAEAPSVVPFVAPTSGRAN